MSFNTIITFGKVKNPCEDCLEGECTMNCSGKELAAPEIDSGSLFITREDDGTVTVKVRSPHQKSESKVNMPYSVWRRIR